MNPWASADDYFVANYDRLINAARRLTDDDLAADVVQDLYTNCKHIWSTIEVPQAYLSQAILRAVRSERLRRIRERRAAERAAAERAWPREPSTAHEIHDQRIAQAVGELSPRQRQCVVLSFYFDYKQVEIAEILGITAGSVERYLIRATNALATALADYRLQQAGPKPDEPLGGEK